MRTLFQGLRYALRQLIHSPGFSLTAVLSLAPGIGATTAVFSVVHGALLIPLLFARRSNSPKTHRNISQSIFQVQVQGLNDRMVKQMDGTLHLRCE